MAETPGSGSASGAAASPLRAEITVAETAELLGVTTRRVRDLLAEGAFAKQPSGRIVLADAVAGHRRVLAAERQRQTGGATDAAFRQARADELALRTLDRSRALVDAARAEAVAVVDELAGALRAELSAVAANATDDIPTRRRIEDLTDDAFRNAARRARRAAPGPGAAGRPVDAGAPVHAGAVGAGKPPVPRKRGAARAA